MSPRKELEDLKEDLSAVCDELIRARSRLGLVDSERSGDRRLITEQRREIAQLRTDLHIGRLMIGNVSVMARLRHIFSEPGDHIADVRAMITWLDDLPTTGTEEIDRDH